jgi:hypothetical protein
MKNTYRFTNHDEAEESIWEAGLAASWGTWSCLQDIDGSRCYCIDPEATHVAEVIDHHTVWWVGIEK